MCKEARSVVLGMLDAQVPLDFANNHTCSLFAMKTSRGATMSFHAQFDIFFHWNVPNLQDAIVRLPSHWDIVVDTQRLSTCMGAINGANFGGRSNFIRC